ncbi:MAG: hypothetical protein MK135_11230 [Polyangiaceae bacterium]|nr:hypothetical protein [Polyangiaceae bacterium]
MLFHALFGPGHRKDTFSGLTVLLLAIVGSLSLSLWAREQTIPRAARTPGPPTKDVPGFPQAVDPFQALAQAAALSERELFVGVVVDGVLPDGRVDLSKPKTKVRYSFQSARGLGPQPSRPAGTLPKNTYCGKQNVILDKEGLVAQKDRTKQTCGRKPPLGLSVPESCTLADVMSFAKSRKNLPKKGPVRIEFFQATGGPAYRFSKGGKKRFTLAARDCRSLLQNKAAMGRVP